MTGVLSQLTDVEALRFAEPNTAFYDTVAPVREVIAQRSAVLAALSTPANPLIIASPRALMHPMQTHAAFLTRRAQHCARSTGCAGESLQHWVSIGYENEQVVERPGAFCRRGGIVDVWPSGSAQPVRIELFGNVADSIRYFDPGTQRSGQALKRVTVLPLDMPTCRAGVSLADYLDASALFVIDDELELQAAWEALEDKAKRERDTLAERTDSDEAGPKLRMPDRGRSRSTERRSSASTRKPYIAWPEFVQAVRARSCASAGAIARRTGPRCAPLNPRSGPLFKQAPHFAGQLTTAQDYLAAHSLQHGSGGLPPGRAHGRGVVGEPKPAAPQQGLETPPPRHNLCGRIAAQRLRDLSRQLRSRC